MNKESKSMKFRGAIKHGKLASSAPSVKAVRRFRTKPYEAANLVKKQGEYLSELPHHTICLPPMRSSTTSEA